MSCPLLALVDRHFEGRISPDEERVLRDHLAGCAACRERYQRRLLLQRLDPRALPARERLAVGLGLTKSRRPWMLPVALLAPAAAAVILLLLLLPRPAPVPDAGFVTRGGGTEAQAVRLLAYRIPPAGKPAPLEAEMSASDELAFAYLNPAGSRRLLVFGVDARGRVAWYHPAWTDPAADPVAVPIDETPGVHELPEAVRHPLPEGPLVIHGLFLDAPLSVREVERRLAATPGGDPSRLFPEARLVLLRVEVRP